MARARQLVEQGNISAARSMLERAAEGATRGRYSRWRRPITRKYCRHGVRSAYRATLRRPRSFTVRRLPAASRRQTSNSKHCNREAPMKRTLSMIRLFAALLSTMLVAASVFVPAVAQQTQQAPRPLSYEGMREKVNAWTVGLAAGLLEGAPIRFATEMARVVDDGPSLHVLPVVTRGPTENWMRCSICAASIWRSSTPTPWRSTGSRSPTFNARHLHAQSLPVGAAYLRPSRDQSLQDLAGKKVNFNTPGTAAAYSGPLIFSRLGHQHHEDLHPAPCGAAADA